MRNISEKELTLEVGREFNRLKKLAFPDEIFRKARNWRTSDSGRASFRKYKRSKKGRLSSKRYNNSPARVAYMRQYRIDKIDPEKSRIRFAAWSKANPEKEAAKAARYRSRKRSLFVAGCERAVLAIYARAKELRQWFDVAVDHIIPISKGGPHCPSNLQIVYRHENIKKGARLDYVPLVIFS